MNSLCNSSAQLSIKFEGDTSIDADFLLNSLAGFIRAYRTTVCACCDSQESAVEIRVCSFEAGSFNVVLDTVIQNWPIISEHLPTVINGVSTFVEIIKMKRELKGAKPASVEVHGEQAKVINVAGDVNYYNSQVYNIYLNNPSIDEALSESFGIIGGSQRPAVCVGNSRESVLISREECGRLRLPILDQQDIAIHTTTTNTVEAMLLIKHPDLLGNSKWDFVYKGKVIHAAMEDEVFDAKVKRGDIKFAAGMYLSAQMRIEVCMNECLEEVRRSYAIIKVHGDVISREDYEGQQSVLSEFIQ